MIVFDTGLFSIRLAEQQASGPVSSICLIHGGATGKAAHTDRPDGAGGPGAATT